MTEGRERSDHQSTNQRVGVKRPPAPAASCVGEL
jgi:hypothetical protein